MPYVNHRWLGGLLTNFQTINQRIRRLHDLERYETEGQLGLLPTRERMAAEADLAKLRANLGGVKYMQRTPDAMFVIDLKTEAIAVREAQRLRIPIIGLVDTNCDPDGIDFVIPGNDDAIRSCAVVAHAIGDAVARGRLAFARRARRGGRSASRREAEERARREAEEQARREAEAGRAPPGRRRGRGARRRRPPRPRPRRRRGARLGARPSPTPAAQPQPRRRPAQAARPAIPPGRATPATDAAPDPASPPAERGRRAPAEPAAPDAPPAEPARRARPPPTPDEPPARRPRTQTEEQNA